MFDDRELALIWAKQHWHVALLAQLQWLSPRAAAAAWLASVLYVGLTTRRFTRRPRTAAEK